jgi:hypothetical protein
MTARDFAYWLQGYFEIAQPTSASTEVLTMIKKHLDMVFVHEIDPSYGGPAEQAKLNAVHNQAKPLTSEVPAHLRPGGLTLPGGAIARC